MIVSNLQNSARVESLHPLFKQLFDYVKANDLLNAPLLGGSLPSLLPQIHP